MSYSFNFEQLKTTFPLIVNFLLQGIQSSTVLKISVVHSSTRFLEPILTIIELPITLVTLPHSSSSASSS